MACRLCYREGHNRNNCPSYPNASPKTKRKARCSYCYRQKGVTDTDHNRSNCSARKADLKTWIEENKKWAVTFKSSMLESGIGIGSIVEWYGEPYYINDIIFEMTTKDATKGYRGVKLEHAHTQYEAYYNTMITNITDTKWVKVVSPVSKELLEKQFPQDWESGLYGLPDLLKDTVRVSRKKQDGSI